MNEIQSTILFVFYLVIGVWFVGFTTIMFLKMNCNVKAHIKNIEDEMAFDRLLDNDPELRKLHSESYDIIDDATD